MALDAVFERLKRAGFALEDWWFDVRNGVRTRGIIAAGRGSDAAPKEAVAHATAYQAVWCRNLRVLIREARSYANPDTFVDIGSGKGKACFYAARRFARVIGVEYSEPLLHCAQVNLRHSGKRNIEFIHADAANYDVPDLQCLVFLFNPFDAVILERFISNNLARLHSKGSLVAYANDVQSAVLVDYGFECLYKDEHRKLSLWRTSSGSPSTAGSARSFENPDFCKSI